MFLFSDSIFENIRCGNPDAADEAVFEAARHAGLDEFVAGLPRGYDTMIGERGSRVSGGQRQRIALARVFLKKFRILIVDEGTSELDALSARRIWETVDTLYTRTTVIFVCHRFLPMNTVDRIIFVGEADKIISGSHAYVWEQSQGYRDLCNGQMDFEEGQGRSALRKDAQRVCRV